MGPGTKTKFGFRFSSIFFGLVLDWKWCDRGSPIDMRFVLWFWWLVKKYYSWGSWMKLKWNSELLRSLLSCLGWESCGEALGLRSIMLESSGWRWNWNSKLLQSPLSCPGWEALGQESFLFKKRPQILVSFCVGCCCSWSLLISSLWSWVCSIGLFELYLLVFWGVCAGGFFVRGGLWTLWILFSCGVGAFLSVTVAEFCGGSGNLFCCYRR